RGRFRRSLARVRDWCRRHRHDAIADQHAHLCALVRGHGAYFGITGNSRLVQRFTYLVQCAWRYYLDRRSQRSRMKWHRFNCLLKRYSLPAVRIRPLQLT
ncbi:MAG: group II intron reverse transcriptase/maturase, partial [Clostridia bacterium]|nr:group II intron reverse transcriptase/maturase [Deltaproteobacteria bacterium]